YIVQLERSEVRLAGSEDMARISLRVTMIFRREGNTWKVVHRHADPITTARPITTAIETYASLDREATRSEGSAGAHVDAHIDRPSMVRARPELPIGLRKCAPNATPHVTR